MNPKKIRTSGQLRFCERCQDFKPNNVFGSDSRRWDGKSIYCKGCNRERIRKSKLTIISRERLSNLSELEWQKQFPPE